MRENRPTDKRQREIRRPYTNHNRGLNSFRLGQIFSVIYNLAIILLTFWLVNKGEQNLALTIFVINAALIALGILFTFFDKKNNPYKPRRGDRNFRGRRGEARN